MAAMSNTFAIVLCSVFLSSCVYLTAILRIVATRHIVFVFGAISYFGFANIFLARTAPHLRIPCQSKPIAPSGSSPRLLFPFTIFFSLLLPTALLLTASLYGATARTSRLFAILGPHLFLMVSQIVCETVGFLGCNFFTVYTRLGLTVAFVSYRIHVLYTWYRAASVWTSARDITQLPDGFAALAHIVAILNIVFWSFTLLCFLLLYCLPIYIHEPRPYPRGALSQPQPPVIVKPSASMS